jgi:hypothetical protein
MEAGSKPVTAKWCKPEHERSARLGFERSQTLDRNCWITPFNRRGGFSPFNRNPWLASFNGKRWFQAFNRKCWLASLDWNRWLPSIDGQYFRSDFSFKEHEFVRQSLIFQQRIQQEWGWQLHEILQFSRMVQSWWWGRRTRRRRAEISTVIIS